MFLLVILIFNFYHFSFQIGSMFYVNMENIDYSDFHQNLHS